MKVPKMYKSSERYNAGVDIVYDDDSKLQYAPFIYATTESGDSGGDGGDDEEGEDVGMVVNFIVDDDNLDKSWKDIYDVFSTGKQVVVKASDVEGTTDSFYMSVVSMVHDVYRSTYILTCQCNYIGGYDAYMTFQSSSETGVMQRVGD